LDEWQNAGLRRRPVGHVRAIRLARQPLRADSADPPAVLQQQRHARSRAAVTMTGPCFVWFIIGVALPATFSVKCLDATRRFLPAIRSTALTDSRKG
jgi:hypothetical protein